MQLKKYNATLGGQQREYAPLPSAIAAFMGVRKMIAHHLHYLPLSGVWVGGIWSMFIDKVHGYAGSSVRHEPAGLAQRRRKVHRHASTGPLRRSWWPSHHNRQ